MYNTVTIDSAPVHRSAPQATGMDPASQHNSHLLPFIEVTRTDAESAFTFVSSDLTETAIVLAEGQVEIQTAVSSVEVGVDDLSALILALECARDEAQCAFDRRPVAA